MNDQLYHNIRGCCEPKDGSFTINSMCENNSNTWNGPGAFRSNLSECRMITSDVYANKSLSREQMRLIAINSRKIGKSFGFHPTSIRPSF